jgi:hypothetical protein
VATDSCDEEMKENSNLSKEMKQVTVTINRSLINGFLTESRPVLEAADEGLYYFSANVIAIELV